MLAKETCDVTGVDKKDVGDPPMIGEDFPAPFRAIEDLGSPWFPLWVQFLCFP